MAKDKKAYIMDMADLTRKGGETAQERIKKVTPRRRAVMTNDDDEAFIKQYYVGRTDCFRALLIEDKRIKGWGK